MTPSTISERSGLAEAAGHSWDTVTPSQRNPASIQFINGSPTVKVTVRNDIKKEYIYPEETNNYTLLDALNKIDYNGINNPDVDVDNQPMNHKDKSVERFKFIPEGKNIAVVMDDVPEHLKVSKFFLPMVIKEMLGTSAGND